MLKKILVGLAIFLALIAVLSIGANWWVDRKLPEILSDKNDSPYAITYKNLDISLLSRTITATDIFVVPKSSVNSREQNPGFYVDAQKLKISGFGIMDVLFRDRITAQRLTLNKPNLTLLKDPSIKDSTHDEGTNPLDKIIRVSDLDLNNATISMRQIGREKSILDVHNASVTLEGILLTDQTLKRKIPFTYKNYSVRCDSLSYRPSAFYELKTKLVETAPDGLKINQLSFKPRVSRAVYTRSLKMEKDLYDVETKMLALDKIEWGYKDDLLFVDIGTVFFDQLNAKIFRSKTVADDPKKKKLYSQLLRELDFPLTVGLLQLKNSRLSYEEEKDLEDGPGKLVFSNFNMKVTGIASGFGRKKTDDVKIKVNCRFMDVAPFDVDWSFNVLDKSDRFRIIGHIRDFPADALIPFTRPYVKAEFKGKLDDVRFDFTGNDNGSKGDFSLEHSDFKVTVLKKDGKKKNKLISAVANIFVKKDSNEKPKKVSVEVEREKDKSFFNLLWKSVAEGLKQTLL